MASAWVYQDDHQVKKHGEEEASWYVGWLEPEGARRCKSCGPGPAGKRAAERLRRKIEAQLMCGTYRSQERKTWEQFRQELREKVLDGMEAGSKRLTEDALNHFERLIKPQKMAYITTGDVDTYIAARQKEPGKKKGEAVSPATVNKELRHLRAALRFAVDWKCMPMMPRFRFLRELQKIPSYVTGDHFAAIYAACDKAHLPEGVPYPVGDWWRALIVMGYMTGWRIEQMLSVRRDAVDFDAGTVRSRAQDNKGKREVLIKLHPVVLDHLRKLAEFDPHILPWPHNIRTIYTEFTRIQQAAGIHLPCDEGHEHTPACHVYGFHDLRRAFATMNADTLSADALQQLMQHKSYLTTQKYINMARQMDKAVAGLHVPEVLRREAK